MSERYILNEEGDELYPKRIDGSEYYRFGFAVDRTGAPRYARDAVGNEIYPKVKRREVFATLKDGEILPARYDSGRQRYPLDRYGNEYLPVCKITGKPYYLTDQLGNPYRPVTVNGYPIYIDSEEDEFEDRLYEKRDALGSKIYTADHKMKSKSVWMHAKEICVILTASLCIICPLL